MNNENEITAKINTVDIFTQWAKVKNIKPSFYLKTNVAARTDLGLVRENNEDKYEIFDPGEPEILAVKGSMYAVADGMGGHSSGQIASEIALKTIVRSYYSDTSDDVEKSIAESFKRANSLVFDSSMAIRERNGMGTTCTALIIKDNYMIAAQVGDSRLYRIRDNEIKQITEDHSWVAEQVKRGALTREEAEMSPFKNVITRSIGASPDVEVDIISEKIKQDDIYILCSDGLSGYIKDDEIYEIASKCSPPIASLKLIDRASENGGGDNITVVIVSIVELYKKSSNNVLNKLLGG